MKEVFEKIKQRIIITATEAYGYTPMTRVASEAELKEILENVEEEYGDGWIPCSKRLPEEYNSIFAKYKGTDKWDDAMYEKISGTVNVTVVDENGKGVTTYAHTTDGNWSCDLLECNKAYKIVAWQPLPAPYQPKGE